MLPGKHWVSGVGKGNVTVQYSNFASNLEVNLAIKSYGRVLLTSFFKKELHTDLTKNGISFLSICLVVATSGPSL